MRRLTVILGLVFGSLLVLPAVASAATAIEYGLVAAAPADEDWH